MGNVKGVVILGIDESSGGDGKIRIPRIIELPLAVEAQNHADHFFICGVQVDKKIRVRKGRRISIYKIAGECCYVCYGHSGFLSRGDLSPPEVTPEGVTHKLS